MHGRFFRPRKYDRLPAEKLPLVRVFAGQADPNDESKFTIRYQMWGKEDVLDGSLDDAGNVWLNARNPPGQLAQ